MICVTVLSVYNFQTKGLFETLQEGLEERASFFHTTIFNNEYNEKGYVDDNITIIVGPMTLDKYKFYIELVESEGSQPIIYLPFSDLDESTSDLGEKLDVLVASSVAELKEILDETVESVENLDLEEFKDPYLNLANAIKKSIKNESEEYLDYMFFNKLAKTATKVRKQFMEDCSPKLDIKLKRLASIADDYSSVVDKPQLVKDLYKEAVMSAMSDVLDDIIKLYAD